MALSCLAGAHNYICDSNQVLPAFNNTFAYNQSVKRNFKRNLYNISVIQQLDTSRLSESIYYFLKNQTFI